MSRKTSREQAYRLIFEYLFNRDECSVSYDIVTSSADITAEDVEFITSLYRGVISHFDELKSIVAECARGYVIDRIYKPDLAALLLASYEMIYTDTPKLVAISEAVDLVKSYSTEKSGSYVNGILAGILKKIESKED